MKNKRLANIIRYRFDRLMSSGPLSIILMLFFITCVVALVIGLCVFLLSSREESFPHHLWMSLMHALDAGTLAGDSTDNIGYLIFMSLATLCGLFITSTLIGVIASGIESKIYDLKKGRSIVQECDHTVIIGFNENIHTLISELIIANANKKRACIVILGNQDKEEMEDAIAVRHPDTKTTSLICRSGGLHEDSSLERCAVRSSRSVIVNTDDDLVTIKCLLSLVANLKKGSAPVKPSVIASIQDKQHIEAASIASEGLAKIIYAKDAISRIISHTCREHGLSQVLTELLNFSGNELYIENIPSLCGKTMHEASRCFRNATVVGIVSPEKVRLNPPMDTVIGKNDRLVLLEADDGTYILNDRADLNEAAIIRGNVSHSEKKGDLVILGSNDKLPLILKEYSRYVSPGTKVFIIDSDIKDEYLPSLPNLEISVHSEAADVKTLHALLTASGATNVLLLNDDSDDSESSDSKTLLLLILLRSIADNAKMKLSITTEMRNPENQRLASNTKVDDFVIGSNFISLMMAQISESPRLMPLIEDLLDESGSEFYMKPAHNYVQTGVPINGYTLTESAACKGEIYIGYRHTNDIPANVIINPDKNESVVFDPDDLLIVISEN